MLNEFDSYLYGLILTDGTINSRTRNRGKIAIELRREDRELLEKIKLNMPECTLRDRVRETNFKQYSESSILSIFKKEIRERFIGYGIPITDKSIRGTIPNQQYSEKDFWRGVFDGNGSIGFTGNGEPYVSLVTKSENLKTEFLKLLFEKYGIKKHLRPNKRDGVYNIVAKNEDAQLLSAYMYDGADIFMQRKYDSYIAISKWVRTKKRVNERSWTDEEIDYIQVHTIDESVKILNRTRSSIKMKIYRLRKSNKNRTIS